MFQYILFDLDGTLTDPMQGITKSVRYALNAYGINVEDLTELCPFIGPPLKQSFIEFYDFSAADAANAVLKYREYFSDQGKFDNQVYAGIPEVLKRLKSSGKQLMVATSKPEVFAKQILKHFELDSFFDFIGGATLDGQREEKVDVIRYVMAENRITDLAKVIMIGDRQYDINGAKEMGISSAGVLYGYGDREELEHAGADYILSTVAELDELLR